MDRSTTPRKPRKPNLSIARVTAAIREHATISEAAKALGYNRETVSRFVARHGLQAVVVEMREDLCDLAEDSLRLRVKLGDVQAITYALDTLGKRRGYIRRIQDVAAVANLEALRRIVERMGVAEIDDVDLMTAVAEVKAELDAERG